MKYLLSTNKITSNLREYISDLIKLNLLIRNKEIPYWRGGSEDIVEAITEDEIVSAIRATVSSIIEKISNSIPGTSMSLDGVYCNNSNIKIKVLIDDSIETYDIKRNN